MNKDDLIKMFVVFIVFAFILGLFSFRGSGDYGGPPSAQTPVPSPQSGLFGSANVDGTVVAYPDGVLLVRGAGAGPGGAVGARLSELVREGRVSYINSAGDGSANLVLPAGADVSGLALNLTLEFPHITTSAKAQIALPERIEFNVPGGLVTAGAARRPIIMIEPLVPVGGEIALSLSAIVEQGKPATDIQVAVAELEGVVDISAEIQGFEGGWYADAVYSWESRGIDAVALESELKSAYPGSSFAYHANPFILLEQNASEEQAAAVQKLEYVNLVTGKTVLVEQGFFDRETAEADFFRILNSTGFSFPDSYFELNATSGEPDAGVFEKAFAGAKWSRVLKHGRVSLGTRVEIEGREYVLPGGASFTAMLPANASVGERIEMPFMVEVSGARILSVGASP